MPKAADRPHGRNRIARIAESGPAVPCAFEKTQVAGRMHALYGSEREAVRRGDRADVVLGNGLEDEVGALGLFEAGDEFAAVELELAAVEVVVWGVDDVHGNDATIQTRKSTNITPIIYLQLARSSGRD